TAIKAPNDGRVVEKAEMVFMAGSGPAGANPTEIAVMNLDGSSYRQLTNDGTQKFLPHFSPDATSVVYTKFTTGSYGAMNAKTDIAIYDFTTKRETVLTNTGTSSQASFSPDGKRIVYGHGVGTMDKAPGGLSIMNVDESNSTSIGGPSGNDGDKVW